MNHWRIGKKNNKNWRENNFHVVRARCFQPHDRIVRHWIGYYFSFTRMWCMSICYTWSHTTHTTCTLMHVFIPHFLHNKTISFFSFFFFIHSSSSFISHFNFNSWIALSYAHDDHVKCINRKINHVYNKNQSAEVSVSLEQVNWLWLYRNRVCVSMHGIICSNDWCMVQMYMHRSDRDMHKKQESAHRSCMENNMRNHRCMNSDGIRPYHTTCSI